MPFGYVAGLQADPVEKKPFFHVLPGEKALSFGMLGCNFRCDFCQNFVTSQALKEPAPEDLSRYVRDLSAPGVVRLAHETGCPVVVSTYNEPALSAEWAAQIFDGAKAEGLLTGFVSNGYLTEECLDFLAPRLDLLKVDLKAFREETYRKVCGASLAPVLSTIEGALRRGIWVEVVTLVVPGLNDSAGELRDLARHLASLSRDLPWHVTAFHPDYQREDTPATNAAALRLAWETGRGEGLHYVYCGNLPGGVESAEDTRCPSCGKTVVERTGYHVTRRNLLENGACAACGTVLPGRWGTPGAVG